MTEPTVQVPKWMAEHAEQYLRTAGFIGLANDFDDLLSQPTPSAEAACTCDHSARTHDAMPAGSFACHVLGCRCRTFTPAPPRIEDMAPGTTFGIEFRWTVVRDPSGATFLYRDNNGYAQWLLASDVDPSTIRDVTPPS